MNAKLIILTEDGKEVLSETKHSEFLIGHKKDPEIKIVSNSQNLDFYQNYKDVLEKGDIPLILNPAIPEKKQVEIKNTANFHPIKINGTQILCSSGTSSIHLGRNFVFEVESSFKNAHAHIDSIKLLGFKRVLLPLPISHSFGLVAGLIGSLREGHELYISREGGLSPLAILEAIKNFKIDHLYLTPALSKLLVKILKRKKEKITGLGSISIGSSLYLCEELLELMSFFPETKFFFTYGLTEMGPRAFTFFAGTGLEPKESLLENLKSPVPIGLPIHGVDYKVEENELLVKSSYRALNIHDEFFKTKDRADIQGDHLRVHGRIDFTIIKSGINIYPDEIEGLFASFEEVMDAALIPKESELYGQVPVLIIQSMEEGEELLLKIQAFLKENISAHALPSRIIIRKEAFPKTSMGKTKKKLLIEEYKNE